MSAVRNLYSFSAASIIFLNSFIFVTSSFSTALSVPLFKPLINTSDWLEGALRISETLSSKPEDYKNEDNYYFLILRNQKTDKTNWEKQPIPSKIFGDVKRYCNDNNILSQNYIFSTQKSSKMSYNRAYNIIKEICKKTEINKSITTHSFRRSRASHWLDNNMDLYTVSKLLRHKSIITTMKYLKISKKSLFDKMKKIDDKILL